MCCMPLPTTCFHIFRFNLIIPSYMSRNSSIMVLAMMLSALRLFVNFDWKNYIWPWGQSSRTNVTSFIIKHIVIWWSTLMPKMNTLWQMMKKIQTFYINTSYKNVNKKVYLMVARQRFPSYALGNHIFFNYLYSNSCFLQSIMVLHCSFGIYTYPD